MVRKRCIRCRKHVRDDGTCQNPNCVLYVPDPVEPETPTQTESNADTEPTP